MKPLPRSGDVSDAGWTWLAIATTVAAAVLRLVRLDSPLWYDEITSLVLSVRRPLRVIVTSLPGVNTHPLYSILAHLSIQVFGDSAWSLRLPACAAGAATVFVVYVFGATLVSRAEAWAAAAILAVSYEHVWFSQNARGYTLMALLALTSTALLLRAERTGRAGDCVWYALACVASVYTHLVMVLVVAGQAASVFARHVISRHVSPPRRLAPIVWSWIAAGVFTCVAYAPFVPGLRASLVAAHAENARVTTAGWALADAWRSLSSGMGGPLVAGTAALGVVGLFSLSRRRPLVCAVLLAPAGLTAIAIAVLHWPARPRFFFFLAGAVAIFVARGLGAMVERLATGARRWRTAGIVAGTLAIAAASTPGLARNYEVPKQDFDSAVAFMADAEQAGATMAAVSAACWPLTHFYNHASWRCVESDADWRAAAARQSRTLVMYTLTDYIEDPDVAARLRTDCPVVRRFPGTLGGGDVVVCEMTRSVAGR